MIRKVYFTMILALCLSPISALAIEVRSFSDIPIKNDIVLGPAKVELRIDEGHDHTTYLDVLNRTGSPSVISLDVEDFLSDNETGGAVLNKSINAPSISSLSPYVTVPKDIFVLEHGQQAHIPIEITIPRDLSPRGLYGAVLVSAVPQNNVGGATKVVTRLGSLFFVKVNGKIKEAGEFKQIYRENNKIVLTFENSGDIYLNPYGAINVYEYYSRKLIKKIVVDPWFVLPGSTRMREFIIGDLGPGKYAAQVDLNRGYNDIVDYKELIFDVSSQQTSYGGLVTGVIIISLLWVFFFYKF